MRQCLLDDGAIDALSASIIAAKNFDLSIDVSMNFFDDAIVDELLYPEKDSTVLASMAERHMDYMNRIADSRKRQLEAVESAAARRQNIGSFFDDGEFSEEYFEWSLSLLFWVTVILLANMNKSQRALIYNAPIQSGLHNKGLSTEH